MEISHNLVAMNVVRMQRIVTGRLQKVTENYPAATASTGQQMTQPAFPFPKK